MLRAQERQTARGPLWVCRKPPLPLLPRHDTTGGQGAPDQIRTTHGTEDPNGSQEPPQSGKGAVLACSHFPPQNPATVQERTQYTHASHGPGAPIPGTQVPRHPGPAGRGPSQEGAQLGRCRYPLARHSAGWPRAPSTPSPPAALSPDSCSYRKGWPRFSELLPRGTWDKALDLTGPSPR